MKKIIIIIVIIAIAAVIFMQIKKGRARNKAEYAQQISTRLGNDINVLLGYDLDYLKAWSTALINNAGIFTVGGQNYRSDSGTAV